MKKIMMLLACVPLMLCGCADMGITNFAEQEAYANKIVYSCPDDADDIKMDLIRTVLESRASAMFGSENYRADVSCQAHEITVAFNSLDAPSGALFAEISALPNAVEFRRGEDETGELILDNDEIADAYAAIDSSSGGYAVVILLCDAGKEAFAAATQELVGTDTPISVWIDGELLVAPRVATVIADGNMTITGDYTYDQAEELAQRFNMAYLPYEITVKEAELAPETESAIDDAA